MGCLVKHLGDKDVSTTGLMVRGFASRWVVVLKVELEVLFSCGWTTFIGELGGTSLGLSLVGKHTILGLDLRWSLFNTLFLWLWSSSFLSLLDLHEGHVMRLSSDTNMKIAILVSGHIDIVSEEIVTEQIRLSIFPARIFGIEVLDLVVVLTGRHLEGLHTNSNRCRVVGSYSELCGVWLNWAINISRIGLRAKSPGVRLNAGELLCIRTNLTLKLGVGSLHGVEKHMRVVIGHVLLRGSSNGIVMLV